MVGFGKLITPFEDAEAGTGQDQGAAAILLGSLLGGGMQTFSNRSERKNLNRQYDAEDTWWSTKMGSAMNGFLSTIKSDKSSIMKNHGTEEAPNYVDAAGNSQVDMTKVRNM